MENVIHRLTLDLTGPDTIPRVEVQQDNARSLSISLTQGGRPYWIAEGVTAVFSGRKPDGKPLFNACTIEKNRVRYDFTDQTTNVAGIVECEILLYFGDERILASPRFELAIDELIHKDGDVPESAPEISALTQMVAAGTAMLEDLGAALAGLDGVEEILEQARAAVEAASSSEAAAKGHAKTAADAAADALDNAGKAYTAAQQASKYAYEANQSAQNAAAEREAVENAVADALGYAEDAEAQAVTAGNYAKAAEESAQRAEAAAGNAGGGSAGDINDAIANHETNLAAHAAMQNNLNALRDKAISEAIGSHETNLAAHADIRNALEALRNRVNAALNSDDVTLDQMAEIVAYIKSNKTLIDAITTSKVSVADIVNNLVSNVANKPLSAAMGVALAGEINSVRSALAGYQPKGEYLLATALGTAIDTALAEAQASGQFDGADGRGIKSIVRTAGNGAAGTVDTYTITYTDGTTSTFQVRNGTNGTNGKAGDDGITPHIGSNGNWYIGSTDTGVRAKGIDGADGNTPVRGVDYWTAADQEAIVQQVIAALGTPVFGRVDGENNIILTGELADGTYTVKYEDNAGNVSVVGNINKGGRPIDVNLIPLSINADGTQFVGANGEDGYKAGFRLNSAGAEVERSEMYVTGFMPVETGDTITFDNVYWTANDGANNYLSYIVLYDADFAKIAHTTADVFKTSATTIAGVVSDGVFRQYDVGATGANHAHLVRFRIDAPNAKYLRISSFLLSNASDIQVMAQ